MRLFRCPSALLVALGFSTYPLVAHAEPPGAAPSSDTLSTADSFEELEAALAAESTSSPGVPTPATQSAESTSSPGAPTPATQSAASAPPRPPAPSVQISTVLGSSASAMNPAISAILDVAAAYFSDDPPPGGHHDPHETGFSVQQLEIAMSGSVDPYLRFDANLVFCHGGAEIEEVYGTTLALPAGLQARFGQFLTRFGRANATHPHTWNFADQPFELTRLFGGEGERGVGVELSMVLPLPWSVELVASATEASGEGSTRSFLGEDERPMESLLDPLYTTALKQFFALSNDWSLAWGLSANFGPNATGDDHRTEIYGTDLYLKYRPLARPVPPVVSLHSEWFYRHRQVEAGSLRDFGQFTEVLWRFARRWATAARYELGSPTWDGAGEVAFDPLDPDWTETRHRASTSVSFYPTEFSRFRWQWGSDLPHPPHTIWSTFLTAEIAVGAHGAHSF